jgi:hypothetical protein
MAKKKGKDMFAELREANTNGDNYDISTARRVPARHTMSGCLMRYWLARM